MRNISRNVTNTSAITIGRKPEELGEYSLMISHWVHLS